MTIERTPAQSQNPKHRARQTADTGDFKASRVVSSHSKQRVPVILRSHRDGIRPDRQCNSFGRVAATPYFRAQGKALAVNLVRSIGRRLGSPLPFDSNSSLALDRLIRLTYRPQWPTLATLNEFQNTKIVSSRKGLTWMARLDHQVPTSSTDCPKVGDILEGVLGKRLDPTWQSLTRVQAFDTAPPTDPPSGSYPSTHHQAPPMVNTQEVDTWRKLYSKDHMDVDEQDRSSMSSIPERYEIQVLSSTDPPSLTISDSMIRSSMGTRPLENPPMVINFTGSVPSASHQGLTSSKIRSPRPRSMKPTLSWSQGRRSSSANNTGPPSTSRRSGSESARSHTHSVSSAWNEMSRTNINMGLPSVTGVSGGSALRVDQARMDSLPHFAGAPRVAPHASCFVPGSQSQPQSFQQHRAPVRAETEPQSSHSQPYYKDTPHPPPAAPPASQGIAHPPRANPYALVRATEPSASSLCSRIGIVHIQAPQDPPRQSLGEGAPQNVVHPFPQQRQRGGDFQQSIASTIAAPVVMSIKHRKQSRHLS
ncbi:hypothetical protein NMY22_g17968 [Coprinellus aureogranulatus]|nr:hypothetical protein NMY22_g17968 [Coprinellus aureogranulatus]